MLIRLFLVDSFTSVPFAGNPAGVCLLPSKKDDFWMQKVAREINLSETAFLVPQGPDFVLRWFTPTVEVELCGHATLASSHVLWEEELRLPVETISFHTKSGCLSASRREDYIELDFPAKPDEAVAPHLGLLRALGVTPRYVGRNTFDYLILVDSEEEVRALAPDFTALKQVDVRGIIVTAPSGRPEYDFVSRFFAPAVGINEDPVTGSAHCCLGPFWQRQTGRTEFCAYQASARGGSVKVRVMGNRVALGGQCVTIARGNLLV
jgi:PhzF family phenazine biosynthesis protein